MIRIGTLSPIEHFAFLGVVGLMIVGAFQAARQARRKRELEHIERMKSLEMGLISQPSGLDWPAATVCIAVGAGVPIGSFLIAWLASLTTHLPGEIWFAPAVVSLAALGVTLKLTLRIIEPRGNNRRSLSPGPAASTFEKPAFDPDAYDVVGSRG